MNEHGTVAERTDPSFSDQVVALALLSEPVRRALYSYVASRGAEVGRDEAAVAVGVDRSLAAFHLDKLAERGLLEVTFRRLTGRSGPGSGRPAKLYRRSGRQHDVSLPPRRYELAARLLAEAMATAESRPARDALDGAARRLGRNVGRTAADALRPRAGRERRLAALVQVLEAYGYEPRRDGGDVQLANCPFHALSESHRELVCAMNRSLLEGLLEGMAADDLAAEHRFEPGHCCVTVSVTSGASRRS